MVKQVIVVRSDLSMGRGKTAAQVAHASLGAFKKVGGEVAAEWEKAGGKKVVLKADLDRLRELRQEADASGLPSYMVKDAGLTQLEPGTITALGIGPAEDKKLKFTEDLKLL